MEDKKILYIDMDGVVVDFYNKILEFDPTLNYNENSEEYYINYDKVDRICEANPYIFEDMLPLLDSVDSVVLLDVYYDVYFLSTPMWNVPQSFTSKRNWIEKYFPHMKKKLILTHRKDLNIGDYLIDDRLKHGVDKFQGEHIHFGTDKFPDWKTVINYLIK